MKPFSRGFVSLLLGFLSNFELFLLFIFMPWQARGSYLLRLRWQTGLHDREMLGSVRKWGPCSQRSPYFLYVTGFCKGAELKNEWLGICWNAAFKGKHSRLSHTRITAWQRQNLASDCISIVKCRILPTVSISEQEKLKARVFPTCCSIHISGPSMSHIPKMWQDDFCHVELLLSSHFFCVEYVQRIGG